MTEVKPDFIFKRAPGDNWIWGTGAAMATVLLMVFVLVAVILYNGLGYFWPNDVNQYTLQDGTVLVGHKVGRETALITEVVDGQTVERSVPRLKLKTGNRDLHADFRWVDRDQILSVTKPDEVVVMERLEYGNFYGFLKEIHFETLDVEGTHEGPEGLKNGLKALRDRFEEVADIQGEINYQNDHAGRLHEKSLKRAYRGRPADLEVVEALHAEIAELKRSVDAFQVKLVAAEQELKKNVAVFTVASGEEATIPLLHIVRFYQPNQMGIFSKTGFYLSKIKELMTENPRESNTEGGLFPAIYGTVLMVLLMNFFCMPIGVVAAIYLREYAKEGLIVRIVRIAVNNLAGVPSIVYGVFGLGFFVYQLGAGIDQVFYPHLVANNEARFGTEGMLWASLTLALLTVPVVIVSAEEAFAAIPRGMREASLALGATKWQTIRNVLLPMASPGILTGFILSMARAAGEVAPLMLTGVLKLVEQLPLDGTFPFLHAERKFMHLGFHIYDMGFKASNVEAALPMVYVTTLLLLIIVITLNLTAIFLRNRMQKKYAMGAF